MNCESGVSNSLPKKLTMKERNENTKYLPFAIGWHGRLQFILPPQPQENDLQELRGKDHKPAGEAAEEKKVLHG